MIKCVKHHIELACSILEIQNLSQDGGYVYADSQFNSFFFATLRNCPVMIAKRHPKALRLSAKENPPSHKILPLEITFLFSKSV